LINGKHDLEKLRTTGLPKDAYLAKISGKYGEDTIESMNNYEPNKTIAKKLAEKANGYTFVIFSATWCKDCKKNVGEFLKIISIEPSIDVLFYTDIKSAPLDPNVRWRIPPSPPEVDEFDLRKIPSFYILNKHGEVIGEMIENPQTKETLEEELVFILENASG